MTAPQDISFRIIDGGKSAELHIPDGFDVSNLTVALLRTIAADSHLHITPEVEHRLAEIIEDYKAAPRNLVAVCATATEPVHGADGGWVWEPAFDPATTVHSSDDGRPVDHHASHIRNAAAGDVIARFTSPRDGVDGLSVTGHVIPARPGHASFLKAGAGLNTRIDGSIVVLEDGVINVSAGVVSVTSILEIKDCVDFNTGHVDFHGDIVVRNSIRDAFLVRATGNITINGPVEGATIVCGGIFTCPRGIASARRAKLLVDGNATVGYLRNVGAIFKGDLACHGEVEHSDISVGGEFHCERGRIIGGTLVLSGNATIGTIGSSAWAPTLVCVGVLPFVAMEWKHLTQESMRVHKEIAQKSKALFELEASGKDDARAREQLTEFQYELSELNHQAAQIDTRLEAFKTEMQKARAAELKVAKLIYPKVRIKCGTSIYEFDRELKGPLRFLLDEHGMIQIKIASQEPQPITDFAHSVGPKVPSAHPAHHEHKAA